MVVRLWSFHPRHLDARGLVALWREGLLARKVLGGKTRGYKRHPQLIRFLETSNPVDYINIYLHVVFEEAVRRGYRFNPGKISTDAWSIEVTPVIPVTDGQLEYEWKLFKSKLKKRSPAHLEILQGITLPEPHPLFYVVRGQVAIWEKAKQLDI